jgi:hypothetical protein
MVVVNSHWLSLKFYDDVIVADAVEPTPQRHPQA